MHIGMEQAAVELDDYVEAVLSEAPRLTDKQRHQLAEVIRSVRIPGDVR
ncbi:hypothetical protein [Mycobacterium sp. E3305]|nr:hypothetical protein [Mycobacterium sp. E3305]